MTRTQVLRELGNESLWDVAIIGGGATGLGTAVEAASRGLRTVLIERSDFAKGTSSRSTKLVHGGVRYLAQMNINLVLDALRERGRMLRNAPHLVRNFTFVVPAYDYRSIPYYAAGLKLYELLSGKLSLGPSKILSRQGTLASLPGINSEGLYGGILYHDGQFDDARYAVSLLRTFQDLGGIALNYAEAAGFLREGDKLAGIVARDVESGSEFHIHAKAIVNATGVFTEQVLALDSATPAGSLLAVSQGSHVVLPRSFLPGSTALMIPKTTDGRVLFAIPWHDAVIVGTTDDPVPTSCEEPRAMPSERQFIIDYVERFLGRRPLPEEVLSVWSGLRPLIKNGSGKTSKLSRDHTILVSASGLLTIAGGKWTTYRKMGEDAIDRVCSIHHLTAGKSRTAELPLHGYETGLAQDQWETVYGSDRGALEELIATKPHYAERIHPDLPYRMGEVVWAARFEMARSVEDVLARRTRALFLNARAAIAAAPAVAALLGAELNRDIAWQERDLAHFQSVAAGYVYEGD